MSNDIRVSNPNGADLFEALTLNKNSAQKPVENNEPVLANNLPTDTNVSGNVPQGTIPANNIDLSEPLQSLDEINQQQYQELMNQDLPDLTNFVPEADPDYLPPINEFPVMQNQEEQEADKSNKHSQEKSIYHAYTALGSKGIEKYATKKVAGIVEKEVATALTTVIEGAAKSAKATGTVATRITEGAAKGVEGTIKALATEGKLGKGIIAPTIKEISKAEGNIIKGMQASYKGGKEVLAVAAAEHGVTKAIPKALQKTATGAGEKVLAEGIAKGTAKGVEKAIAKAGTEATEKLTAKTLEKVAAKATSEATAKAAASGGVKFATGLAKAAPYIATAANIGITAYDIHDAMQKTKDGSASTASKALAWTTVGLDVASTVAMTTGKGKPFGWVATGLSIGTSVLSDAVR